VSWGKFIPAVEGGRFAEVYSDATIAWPLIVKAVQERLATQGVRLHKQLPLGTPVS
jgi:deoxyhypusine synthase